MITHYTLTMSRCAAPAQAMTDLHVRCLPADEAMCSLLPLLAAFHASPGDGEPGYQAQYETTERVIDFAAHLQRQNLPQGWTTTLTPGPGSLTVTTRPTGSPRQQPTWSIRLVDNEHRTRIELLISAASTTAFLTGFIVAFTTAFPSGDMEPATTNSPIDWADVFELLQANIEDLADRCL